MPEHMRRNIYRQPPSWCLPIPPSRKLGLGNYPNESNDQERPPTTKTGPGNNTRRYGAKVIDEQIQEIRKLAVEEMKRYRLLVKFGNIVVGLALGEH